ncbi:MAG TPA: hypothetical protein VK672_07950, partial [Solirubrobacteraceae bacterium]|nr:hypothetical protein [Solirubrobacteraceae bacterium]
SEGGKTIALASAASNLAYGAVGAGSDVFVTREQRFAPGSGQQSVSPLPDEPLAAPDWKISATVSPSRDGSLLLYVSVPGAGSVSASASAAVPLLPGKTARSAHGGHSHHVGGQHQHGSAGASSTMIVRIHSQRFAHAVATAKQAQVIQLRLSPMQAFRPLVERRGGLYATISIAFRAAGHPQLRDELQASFVGALARRSGRKGGRSQR